MSSLIDFEAIFDRSPNPYMLLDAELRFVGANEAYLHVTASRREDIIGRNVFDAFPGSVDATDDSNARQLRASLERVLHERMPDTLALIRYAVPRATPNGPVLEERFWSATHTPIFDERGQVAYILQHTVDVTELQQLKQALRAAEVALDASIPTAQVEEGVFRRAQVVQEANRMLDAERRWFRRLFEQSPGFMAVLRGPQHVFELANDAYYQVIGHRDIIGKPVREALPEVEGQGFLNLLDQVFLAGEPYIGRSVPIRLQREPGTDLTEVFVDFVYQPVIEPDGSIYGIFVQGHDVTEQRRAQEELRRLNATLEQRVSQRTAELEARNRELQEFAYVASHDLQEPLRKVRTFAGLLVSEHADEVGEEVHSYLSRIQNATQRMTTLIADLLAYSRITTQAHTFVRVDLGAVVEDVLSDLQVRLEETAGHVDVGPLPEIEADPLQMRQLFQNLIGNALKFHRPEVPPVVQVQGRIEPATDAEGGDGPICHLEIADQGIGFSQEYAHRIFAPFQRLHGRGQYEGTGIGLAICRRIAERHGGHIWAQSEPGRGSTFIVRLPARQEAAAA